MRKGLFSLLVVAVFVILLLAAKAAYGGGLTAGFEGSRLPCFPDSSLVVCYDSTVDAANNLVDKSGSNLVTFAEQTDHANWTKTSVTVTADQVRGPGSTTLNAELLTPTAADSHVYQDAVGTVGGEYTCAFALRSVTGYVGLSIHLYNQAHTAIRATKAVVVSPQWQTFWVSGILLAGDTHAGCTLGGNSTWSTGENIYAVRANLLENDEWNPSGGPGIYHITEAVTKPLHHLADTNDPTLAWSSLQGVDGNRLEAREFDGATNFYSKAHHDSMNVFDEDFTFTTIVMHTLGTVGYDRVFCHGREGGGGNGAHLFSVNGVEWEFRLMQDGGQVGSDYITTTGDGMYHIIQVVREDNTLTLYYDGVSGGGVDATGYGLDGDRTFFVGVYNDIDNWWDGEIAYLRINSRALSTERLAAEREFFLGFATNYSGNVP